MVQRVSVAPFAACLVSLITSSCSSSKPPPPRDGEPSAPGAETFAKSYGGLLDDSAHGVIATRDGGIVLVGHTAAQRAAYDSTLDAAGGELWLVELDAEGNIEHQALLGEVDAVAAGTKVDIRRVRPTPDGGAVLVGSAEILDDLDNNGRRDAGELVHTDVQVIKLDDRGSVEWARTHDSGGWLNYDYAPGATTPAAAEDIGLEVWPMPDGGYLVAGENTANLVDRLGIGFPPASEPGEAREYVGAVSRFVMRLSPSGELTWTRRLTEHQFVRGPAGPMALQGTADGGAILVASYPIADDDGSVDTDGVTEAYRLAADGSFLWQHTIDGDSFPVDVEQTDDRFDGVRDDGFLLGLGTRVVKLNRDGEESWSRDADRMIVYDVRQFCPEAPPDTAPPASCHYALVGHTDDSGPRTGLLRVFDWSDDEPRDTLLEPFSNVLALSGGDRGELLRVFGHTSASASGLAVATISATTLTMQQFLPTHTRPAGDTLLRDFAFGEGGEYLLRERLADGGADVLTWANERVRRLEISLASVEAAGDGTDKGTAAIEIAPGQLIVAGAVQGWPWVGRYDLATGRLAWQRRVTGFRNASGSAGQGGVTSLAPSSDGGVVLGFRWSGDADVGLVKLDGEGNEVWHSAAFVGRGRTVRDLRATPDGGFVALDAGTRDSGGMDSDHLGLTKLDAAGLIEWHRRYRMRRDAAAIPVDADLDGSADDGYLLAAPADRSVPDEGAPDRIADLVLLDPAGDVVLARGVEMSSGRARFAELRDLRLRQAPDGGFVLAATELGIRRAAGADLPAGQANILLVKLDSDLRPLWGRAYGGLYDERVHALEIMPDGVLLVAGMSESLGERRDAWLLKAAPDGTIVAGCQAQIWESTADVFRAGEIHVQAPPIMLLPPLGSWEYSIGNSALLPRVSTEAETRRQCSGVFYPPSQGEPLPRFTLTIEQAGDVDGNVTSSPVGIDCGTRIIDGVPLPEFCSASFPAGTLVTLRAHTDSGTFRRWDRACLDGTGLEDPVCMIVMERDEVVPVIFGAPPPRHTLRLDVQANGGVSIDGRQTLCRAGGGPAECEVTRGAGASVTLTAVPDGGYVLAAWTGDCAAYGSEPGIDVVIDRDLDCGATFELGFERTISVVVTGAGRVHDDSGLINCREGGSDDDCRESYTQLQTVVLTAEPDDGQVLDQWRGNCEQFGRETRIELYTLGSYTCYAHFIPAPFNPTLNVRLRNGSLSAFVGSEPAGISCTAGSGSDCSETYPGLTPVRLTALPPEDFVGWEGCPQVVEPNHCDVIVDAMRTITAVFRPPSPP